MTNLGIDAKRQIVEQAVVEPRKVLEYEELQIVLGRKIYSRLAQDISERKSPYVRTLTWRQLASELQAEKLAYKNSLQRTADISPKVVQRASKDIMKDLKEGHVVSIDNTSRHKNSGVRFFYTEDTIRYLESKFDNGYK